MILLIAGLVVWFLTHWALIAMPQRRTALIEKLGEVPYKGAYALVTLGSVVLMVIGYQNAPYIDVWTPPSFLLHLNNLLMVAALIFFVGGNIPGGVGTKIRHPQLTAAKTWAVSHLMVNGDLASILLFGAILAWAVMALIASNKRDGKPPLKGPTTAQGMVVNVAVGIILFAVVGWIHGSLLGVWPFPG